MSVGFRPDKVRGDRLRQGITTSATSSTMRETAKVAPESAVPESIARVM